MIYELNHVGAFVSDKTKAVDFYTRVLGGRVVREALIPSSQTACIYIQIDNGLIELLAPADPSSLPKFGFDHVAFMTDSLDQDYQMLVDAGYTPLVRPKIAGSGHGRLGFLSDPNGVRVELIERDSTYRQPRVESGDIRSFDHISLVADDLAGAQAFYQNFFGMKLLKHFYLEPPRNLTIDYFHHGYDVLEFLHHAEPQTGAELIGHIALRVNSVDEVVDKWSAQGIEFEPGFPKNAGIGGRVAILKGPDGEKIELLDRKDLRDL